MLLIRVCNQRLMSLEVNGQCHTPFLAIGTNTNLRTNTLELDATFQPPMTEINIVVEPLGWARCAGRS